MTTFGVEIELTGDHTNRNIQPLQQAVNQSGYRGGPCSVLPNGWKVKTDASISCSSPRFGFEVVSPILNGGEASAIEDVLSVCRTLTAMDAKPNASCGLHVHMDARQLNSRHIDAIEEFFRVYEFAFYGVSGTQIEQRMITPHAQRYCRTSTGWSNQTGHNARYRSLNRTNAGNGDKNTVEARCFASTLEPLIVVGAIAMFHALHKRATIAIRDGHRVPQKERDLRIASPQRAMDAMLSQYFVPSLLPALPASITVEALKGALRSQAVKAERKLNSL